MSLMELPPITTASRTPFGESGTGRGSEMLEVVGTSCVLTDAPWKVLLFQESEDLEGSGWKMPLWDHRQCFHPSTAFVALTPFAKHAELLGLGVQLSATSGC